MVHVTNDGWGTKCYVGVLSIGIATGVNGHAR